jgi:hypothetical protein
MNLKKIIRADYKQLLFVFLAFFLMVVVSYFFTGGIVKRQVDSNMENIFHHAESVNKILIEHLSIPMNGETKVMADLIEQHILMFEYDKAVEVIDRMLED